MPILALLVTSIFLIFGYHNATSISADMEQKFYDDPIIHKETSAYQHLVLTENPATKDVRLYINGNTQFSSLDEDRYHDLLVHPAMAAVPHASNVLILGGGDGLALREVLKYERVERVTLIDLDPAMVKMSATHPTMRKLNHDAFADARVHIESPEGLSSVNVRDVYLREETWLVGQPEPEFVASVDVFNLDADQFLAHAQNQTWDVVIVDFPDPGSVELAKLYSRQFYHRLKAHLAPGAVVSIQSTAPFHAKRVFVGIGSTLRASGFNALPYQRNIASFAQWGFYLAWAGGPDESSRRNALSRISDFEVPTQYLTPEVLAASFAFGRGGLGVDEPCIHSVLTPCP